MKRCPQCQNNDWRLGRTHTVWEVLHIAFIDTRGHWEETEGSDFGDTIETGDAEELTCGQCGLAVNPEDYLWQFQEESL